MCFLKTQGQKIVLKSYKILPLSKNFPFPILKLFWNKLILQYLLNNFILN